MRAANWCIVSAITVNVSANVVRDFNTLFSSHFLIVPRGKIICKRIYRDMQNIAIIFGGRSVEHDVSILTGLHAARHVRDDVRVYLVYIDKQNRFWVAKNLKKLRVRECHFSNGYLCVGRRRTKIDVALNCCHGGIGEGGELAVVVGVAGVPLVGPGYESARSMMSKVLTRKILQAAGFAQPQIYSDIMSDTLQDIVHSVIVKPDTLGSSIGISVVKSKDELDSAIELARSFDNSVIVEQFIEGALEVNCAAFQSNGEIILSECEVMKKNEGLLGFDDKYLGEVPQFVRKGSGGKIAPAPIDPQLVPIFDKIKELTKRAYELFGASGVVRCDFLVVGDEIYLNEINSVPGFLSYHLFIRAGIPYGVLIDMLCREAITKHANRRTLVTEFPSTVLEVNRLLVG